MIIKMIVSLILEVLKLIFGLITGTLSPGDVPLTTFLNSFITFIIGFLQQATNFFYFVFGPILAPVIITTALAMTTYKYVVYPFLGIIRRIFIKGGDA